MAWAIILLASGDEAGAKRLAPRERYPSRMRAWLEGHPLGEHASKLRPRAAIEDLAGHRSELGRLLARPDVLVTGASAGDVVGLAGKVPGVEVYAPAGHRAAILSEHALTPASDGLIRIRWVRDELWPHLHQDRDRRTPRAAVLLDLLESDDPRARRESARALAS